jgi:hypothetical protein
MNIKNHLTLQEHIEKLQKEIETYQPSTKWEEANGRTLKRLILKRNKLEKVLERQMRLVDWNQNQVAAGGGAAANGAV